jgi:3-oxoacyl-[acyl-carrier protein] reductase
MRAFVTGGGRGIGESIARGLASAGWEVTVAARSRAEIESVAEQIGAAWTQVDVTDPDSVAHAIAQAGEIDLLVANAGLNERHPPRPSWEIDPAEWWRICQVNILGVHLCCRAVIPGMLARGAGRIAITASGAAHLPGVDRTAYPASKAAVCRYGETLANELAGRIPVFIFDPGLVKTRMTVDAFADDTPWASPQDAAELVRQVATGRFDALSGRQLHAHDDDLEALRRGIDEVRRDDLNAIRLRR